MGRGMEPVRPRTRKVIRWFVAALSALAVGCSIVPAADGYPVARATVLGATLSCKADQCCWPWPEHEGTSACLRVEASALDGRADVVVSVRSRVR